MKCIGFSTGALARGDFRRALQMLSGKNVNAVELSALRQAELEPLVNQLGQLDLSRFQYISFHAPSQIDQSDEQAALELLKQVAARNWPIIVHPDAMHTPSAWACLGDSLCIENMDKRKPIGQTATDLAKFFDLLPNASLCFDIGHARQVDPTMSEAWAILQRFRNRIKQLHVSEVNTQSKHDPISLESILAFQKVSHLLPVDAPIILESRVEESEIDEEIKTALDALNPAPQLAFASD
ncbi:MAG TPA: TIM barrel protein [Candidatus Acidoferrum sp.]|nr:TIM barrel protein [Candidatus Acidoferrum sp.]